MTAQLWYYQLQSEERGPVLLEEIQQMASRGILSVENLVRPQSSNHWMTVAELNKTLQESVFPESTSSNNMIVQESNTDERHSDLDIDMFNIQSDKQALNEDRNSDLDIDSFNLLSDSQAAPVSTPATGNPEPAKQPAKSMEDTSFTIKTNGEVIGPLTEETLVKMARAGSLTRDDMYQTKPGKWISVRTIPSVYAQIARLDIESAKLNSSKVNSSSASSQSDAGQSIPKRPKKQSSGTAAKAYKKRVRKAAPKKDELLQEIFTEVFTEDGEVNKERLANASRPAAAATPTGSTTRAASPPDKSTIPAYTQSPAAQPAFKPSPKKYPKKKKSSGGGFEMPSPKILVSVGGGVLALLLLVGSVNGFITMPGMGVDAEGFFKEVAAAYPQAHDGSLGEWQKFTSHFSKAAREIASGLGPYAKGDSKVKNQLEAALLIVKFGRVSYKDKEGQDKIFAEFNQLLLGK